MTKATEKNIDKVRFSFFSLVVFNVLFVKWQNKSRLWVQSPTTDNSLPGVNSEQLNGDWAMDEGKRTKKKIDNCQWGIFLVLFPSIPASLHSDPYSTLKHEYFEDKCHTTTEKKNRHHNPIIPQLCHFYPHKLSELRKLIKKLRAGEEKQQEETYSENRSLTNKNRKRRKHEVFHFSIILFLWFE